MNNDGFTKLFSSIVTSSMWSEDDKTRILWITILAITDQDGFCSASVPGLAAVARLSVEQVQASLTKLESPDPFSRTTTNEGRRLKRVEGGWIVLNHGMYRDRERTEKRREYMKELMREKRMLAANDANKVLTGDNRSASVSVSSLTSSKENQEKKEEKKSYGELSSVLLTDPEYAKLKLDNGDVRLNIAIELLDTYIASKGKKYRSHYAVMKSNSWVWPQVEAELARRKKNNPTLGAI